jgi:hypothetical protein
VLLAVDRALAGERAWLIALRFVIAAGFAALADCFLPDLAEPSFTLLPPRYTGCRMKVSTSARSFTTISGVPIEPLYGPEQIADLNPASDLTEPGHFPYTRGIHESMYRGRLWTMRQFSGFATPEETNFPLLTSRFR